MKGNQTRFIIRSKIVQDPFCSTSLHPLQDLNILQQMWPPNLIAVGQLRAYERCVEEPTQRGLGRVEGTAKKS